MDIKALTANLSVSPQILVDEMGAIAQAGFLSAKLLILRLHDRFSANGRH